jgi:hypothetical protein
LALQGTIKDFGLADILQLIGIQRKTGILTLENAETTVTIRFLDGQVVGADTRRQKLEDHLGAVLVRTGRITEAQLREAVQTKKNTLQRLGYILVTLNYISEEELAEALRVQVSQIVYRLFRWRDGRYHFDPRDHVDYDAGHFAPISTETILLEGARMIDEWPIVERRIPSERIVFRKTAAGAAIETPVESRTDPEPRAIDGPRTMDVRLSPEERQILRMVDGRATVEDIVARSALGEFDVYRSLYELLTRNLVEKVDRTPTATAPRDRRQATHLLVRAVLVGLMGLSFSAMATLDTNPLTPWRLGPAKQITDSLRTYVSRLRLERIEQAIRMFYLDTGAMPARLDLLAEDGYLGSNDLSDPWGRPYEYQLAGGAFVLVGLGASGVPAPGLTVQRRLRSSERLVLEGWAGGR